MMDPVLLSRLQFALTISFHYLFPVLTIGLSLMLVLMEGLYLKTNNPVYHRMTHFWVSIFALIFGIGVATGIVMEFQFGTNWANYSRFVGDVFGSALAAEGLFAFFLESGFLAILVFGWDRVSKTTHFLATLLVCLGAHFSAIWIVVANSWQQTPAGFHLVSHNGVTRAEITDFWAMIFNPSSIDRLSHVIPGAWLAGAFLVISVSAYYLLRNQVQEVAKAGLKLGLTVAIIASMLQLISGHDSAQGVARNQPSKLAAMEGHFTSAGPADLHLLGWVDERRAKTTGIAIPGGLGFLISGDFQQPVTGLDAIPRDERPPINITFQCFHLMVMIGVALIAISVTSGWMAWRGILWTHKPMLAVLVVSVLLPELANQVGWWTAEVGRQPWIVYGLMKTAHATSPRVDGPAILASIIMFSFIYILLGILFIYLLNAKIQKGPKLIEGSEVDHDPRLTVQGKGGDHNAY